jgi:eukaryotic-like serine/threonine-protein kinase
VSPVSLGPPKHLGKYEVGAKIGGGGMATVFIGRATGEDGRDDLVALKVIRDEFANDERFATMFVDEAKILARLSHPNVIQTREYGLTGSHRFIAMELLSGRTYADAWEALATRGEALSVRLGAWLCARVAEGLHSAHELVDDTGAPLNVIHRDVNPGNIFLTYGGEVKLIDFGLAKARVRASQSVDGIVKGKIPYLAPEQAQGHPIDRRVDVYALGTTLWETATMKRLFKRSSDVATLMAIRDAEVPDVRDSIDGFPDALWEIIAKATQKSRDDRYATADELRAALDAFVGDATALPGELAKVLTNLFPGEEEKLASWARAATSVRIPAMTMPPPAPVPTASSSILESDTSGEAGGRETGEDVPPATPRPAARRRHPRPADTKHLELAGDPGGARRFWVSLAVVVAVVAALAAMLGAR